MAADGSCGGGRGAGIIPAARRENTKVEGRAAVDAAFKVSPATHMGRSSRLTLAILIGLSAVLSLLRSHARLLVHDEFLSFYTDRVPSIRELFYIQLHSPISLDPPAYHVLSHFSMKLLGQNAMGLRLPALCGFLLMQVSLFFFVRTIAGYRSAVVATILPVLTASFHYSLEGRPYALLFGLYALSLVCWQSATRRDRRAWALTGITVAVALAITSHYFGVLILIPLCAGELVRTIHRRAVDWPIVVAGLIGASALSLCLPFRSAVMVYRQHYYLGAQVPRPWQVFEMLVFDYSRHRDSVQNLSAVVLTLLLLLLVAASWRHYRRRQAGEPAHEWAALLGLALLPLFGYVLGSLATHTFEIRFVTPTIVAYFAAFGIVVGPSLRRNSVYFPLLAGLLIGAIAINLAIVSRERQYTQYILASLVPSAQTRAALDADPTQRIYMQSQQEFFTDSYYTPDPALRSRLTLVYDGTEELRWHSIDTYSIAETNMQAFTGLSVRPYSDLLAEHSPLLLLYPDGWSWFDRDLPERGDSLRSIAPLMRGDLVRVLRPSDNREQMGSPPNPFNDSAVTPLK